ncbi:TSUP family transporter [Phenylobacterium sp.]|uniref:TSUP family transporter n=1 Tax=Phenylobacterium sp. TaxID=1871053 RepID=UPI002731FB6E|nr:TSUP family transporter [Phenylobacterium sp.]MDP1617755.1 TSUP family transporter [Phenylobacterium sp.]MDP1988418.1 TSUP family transporter [Phenylobacterium sp.]
MSGLTIGLTLAAVFVASAISGLLGMAGGSLLMAVLTLILPVSAALALHGAAQLASNLARAGFNARHVRFRAAGWFGLGALSAMGLLSFVAFQPSKAAVFIGMGLLPILVWLPPRLIPLDAARPTHAVAGGFLATLMALAVGVSGPLSELFLVRSSLNRHEVIGTKAAFQVFAHLAKLVFYGGALFSLGGQGEGLALGLVAGVVLAAVAGAAVGRRFLDAISEDHFRRWRRWIFTALGAGFLIQGLRLLAGA